MTEYHYSNHLAHEKSPYLLQHAHDPVEWYPWGEKAFEEARNQTKPIFLSIGYATCHWCHMMRKESFSSPGISDLMNRYFINIKVDREELPEIDALYMEFAQTLTIGSIGWPLNIILSPDLKPFFAMTYVPPESRMGILGLEQMLDHINEIWLNEIKDASDNHTDKIIEALENDAYIKSEELPDDLNILNTIEIIFKLADPLYGGINTIPKFPVPTQIQLMLRDGYLANESRALFYAKRTLDMMQRGGIHDHLGGGFSRYAVDEKWITPHFEKMLYDNALIAQSYLEAWHLTQNILYRDVAIETLEYLLRDMEHHDGGFYSAEDADTEEREGLFYTWTPEEVFHVLGYEEGHLFCDYYDITEAGNFHGRSILHPVSSLEDFAEMRGIQPIELNLTLEAQRRLLWESRQQRTLPLQDRKIISGWNGLAITALAEASRLTQNNTYLEAAQRAALFVKRNLWHDSKLMRRWCDGEVKHSAILEDYAFMIQGLLTLFETSGESQWLTWALEMTAVIERNFRSENGAFFTTDDEEKWLLVRRCEFADSSLPSANGIHCENLIRLYQITKDSHYITQAEEIFLASKNYLDEFSPNYSSLLVALQRYLNSNTSEIVIALNDKEEYKNQIQWALAENYIPHNIVIWRPKDDDDLFAVAPYLEGYAPIDGKTTAYICQDKTCKQPCNTLTEIIKAIKTL
jgi:uncharacterized protein